MPRVMPAEFDVADGVQYVSQNRNELLDGGSSFVFSACVLRKCQMTTTLLERAVEEKGRGGQGVATGNSSSRQLIRRLGLRGAAALAGKRG
jgi:hypothetical protein